MNSNLQERIRATPELRQIRREHWLGKKFGREVLRLFLGRISFDVYAYCVGDTRTFEEFFQAATEAERRKQRRTA